MLLRNMQPRLISSIMARLVYRSHKLYSMATKSRIPSGPICTSYGPVTSDLPVKLFDAAASFGIPRNPDTVSKSCLPVSPFVLVSSHIAQGTGINEGCVTTLLSIDPATAKRSYSASGYLEPNLHRKNLLVMTESQVTKVCASIIWHDSELICDRSCLRKMARFNALLALNYFTKEHFASLLAWGVMSSYPVVGFYLTSHFMVWIFILNFKAPYKPRKFWSFLASETVRSSANTG